MSRALIQPPSSGETTETLGCPVARTAQIIGNKWTPLIVRDLANGERRFSELERSLSGISPKTLSERLKRLEEAHVIERPPAGDREHARVRQALALLRRLRHRRR
jgi:DNA-binding HxlR family transcriptional regulator